MPIKGCGNLSRKAGKKVEGIAQSPKKIKKNLIIGEEFSFMNADQRTSWSKRKMNKTGT